MRGWKSIAATVACSGVIVWGVMHQYSEKSWNDRNHAKLKRVSAVYDKAVKLRDKNKDGQVTAGEISDMIPCGLEVSDGMPVAFYHPTYRKEFDKTRMFPFNDVRVHYGNLYIPVQVAERFLK